MSVMYTCPNCGGEKLIRINPTSPDRLVCCNCGKKYLWKTDNYFDSENWTIPIIRKEVKKTHANRSSVTV